MNWKMWVRMILPILENAGESLKNQDANTTGRDDMIGETLIYISKLLNAALSPNAELPKAPGFLK